MANIHLERDTFNDFYRFSLLYICHCEGVLPEAILRFYGMFLYNEEIASPPEERWRLAMTRHYKCISFLFDHLRDRLQPLLIQNLNLMTRDVDHALLGEFPQRAVDHVRHGAEA